ncbi:hypothetical protein AERO9AM_10504 [Aeromicrobium sp. 9AM]|nr:hypothetical protein AERO9AM_10504 [Aeromicrobium sp. 9AM]
MNSLIEARSQPIVDNLQEKLFVPCECSACCAKCDGLTPDAMRVIHNPDPRHVGRRAGAHECPRLNSRGHSCESRRAARPAGW